MTITNGHAAPVSADRLILVASSSSTRLVAGSIAHALRAEGQAVTQAIGAGAVNQAVKAAALARQFLAAEGISVVVVPEMINAQINGRAYTAVRLVVTTPDLSR